MFTRARSRFLAGSGAMLLALSLTGIAAGASLVGDTNETVVEPVVEVLDTTLTFEDVDGDGVDDDCQDVLPAADEAAAAEALAEADLDGDGTISVSEAAQTDWIGGVNCNHGGYVSGVAAGDEDAEEEAETEPTTCEAAPEPETEPETEPAVEEEEVEPAPNAHGKAVSEVAGSDAVGGKNCNHGGAVSEAAKKDHGGERGNAGAHDNSAKKAAGKAHGKGKGHGRP